jgi:hypothetical protein
MRPAGPALALAILLAACAGERAGKPGPRAPRTAAERARAEHAATEEGAQVSDRGKKWGGWRYQGSRDDCFFLVKRPRFDKRAEACAAARCGKKQCVIEGGGPATVRCE